MWVGFCVCWIVGSTRVGINLRVDLTRVDSQLGIYPNGHDPTKKSIAANGIYKNRKFRAAKKWGKNNRKNRGKYCWRKYSEVRANGGYTSANGSTLQQTGATLRPAQGPPPPTQGQFMAFWEISRK